MGDTVLVRAAERGWELDAVPGGGKRPFMPCKMWGTRNQDPLRLRREGGGATLPWQPAWGSPQIRQGALDWSPQAPPPPPRATCGAGCHWRSHPRPLPQLQGPVQEPDSEQSIACHGMVFSMDFQETKKETKSKKKKKNEGVAVGAEKE